MNRFIEKLISTAAAETGYLEKSSNSQLNDKTANAGSGNYTKYGAWYGINPGAWCAMFVSWCACMAGIGDDIIPRHASCSDGAAKFKKLGRWRSRDSYEPQTGDIIYFSGNGISPSHVGIVTGSDSVWVYTIEGNTSAGSVLIPNGGSVAEKKYARGYSGIFGYASPAYPEENTVDYEDFVKFMRRYEAEKAAEKPSEWSLEAREWAEKNGIIRGDGDGFRYRAPLTREEYVTMEYRQMEADV